MKLRKTAIAIAILSSLSTLSHAQQNYAYPKSGHIIGRDLNFPGMGWIGHLAMATGDNVFGPTITIIEAMPTVGIQFNTFNNHAKTIEMVKGWSKDV